MAERSQKKESIKEIAKKSGLRAGITFSQLLGKEPIIPDDNDDSIPSVIEQLNIRRGPFTMDEYVTVKRKITENKTAGSDKIPPEVLKICDLDNIILKFANNFLTNNKKTQQWSELDIVTIPKKGDLSFSANYRGISLSSIVAKTINRMISNRIQPALDDKLRPNQNGSRPGRSTAAQVLALRRIIESVTSHNLKATLLLIDFKKAFDSVHRCIMIKILEAYGIPEKLIIAVRTLHKNTRARVLTPDGQTDYFDILAGVL